MSKLIIGCGYLGGRVAARWMAMGQAVFAVTRGSAEALRRDGVTPIIADVLVEASLRKLPQVDTVLYAVGFDRKSGASMRDVYVQGLANVLEQLPPPKKFIYVSSSSVYGQADGSWVDEGCPTQPQEESGRIVLEAERTLKRQLPSAAILRFAGIYGPGRLLRQKAIEAGEVIVGDSSRWLNLIHVDDGARAVLAAGEKGTPGLVCNVCDDLPVRRIEFYTELARLLGSPAPRFRLPDGSETMPPHEKGNRRLSNRFLKEALGFQCEFATFREGLANATVRA